MAPIRLSVLTGRRAGNVSRFQTSRIVLGRAAETDLQLDPDEDLAVSAIHAVLEADADGWLLLDAGSTNGTFLNDVRIDGPTRVGHGDRLRLGASGPTLRFEQEGAGASGGPPTRPSPRGQAPSPTQSSSPTRSPDPTPPGGPSGIRGQPLAWGLGGLILAAGLVLGLLAPLQRERAEVRALTERLDSLQRVSSQRIAGLRDQVSGLQAALEASGREVAEVADDLRQARSAGNEERTALLEQRFEEVAAEFGRRERAAGIDFARVARLNRPALAEIYVELGPDEVQTATAFAVQPDGLLLTNQHVVDGVDGPASRVAVQFSGSEQIWPADVVARSPDSDLAALRVRNIVGDVPTIAGFNRRLDTLDVGLPVVILGFPLGGAEAGGRVEAVMGAGTIRALLPTQIQVSGYGAPGSSGSPVLDPDGRLVGIVRGGQERPDGTTLVAIPSSAALRFMEDVLALERAERR